MCARVFMCLRRTLRWNEWHSHGHVAARTAVHVLFMFFVGEHHPYCHVKSSLPAILRQ